MSHNMWPSHTQSAPGLDAGSQSPVEDWDWTPTGDSVPSASWGLDPDRGLSTQR